MITQIYINSNPKLQGERSPKYTARIGSPKGEILCKSSEPLYDSCRVLLEKGITGTVEMWDEIRPYLRMTCDIEKGAKLTVKENKNTSVMATRFTPMSDAQKKKFRGSS